MNPRCFRAEARYAALLYGSVCMLLGLGVTGKVSAQEDEIDTIVVTGTRTTNALSEIPSSISVVNLEDIEARNAMSVTDLLQDLPGLHVVQPSGQGGVARIFLRGGDQNLTMILVDGVRVNDPLDSRGSAFDFSMIDLNDVERIEVVRGPHSAVYGSDALAGVINVITKSRFDELAGSIVAEVGTDEYYRAGLDLSGPVGNSGGFVLRYVTNDDGDPVPGTTFSSDTVSGRLSFADGDQWEVRFFGNYSDSDGTAYPEDSGGSRLAVLSDVDVRAAEDLRIGLNGNAMLSDAWRLNFLATRYDHEASFYSPGVAPGERDAVPPNGADSDLERNDFALNAVVELGDAVRATLGVDYYKEDGISDGFVEFFPGFNVPAGFEFDRSVTGLFGEIHYQAESGLTLLGSVRRDDPDNESGETTSRVGFKYAFGDSGSSVQANWGQGFSLPGFFALASPLVGNPELRPEKSRSYDAGVTWRSADQQSGITLTLFHNEFDDLIDFDSNVFQMVNRDRLDVDGVEMQVDVTLSESLSLRAHATHLNLDLIGSDEPIRQRPEWRGGASVLWTPADSWLIRASWLSVGETYDSSIPTGPMTLDGYNRLDVTATYRRSDSLQFVASVDNLLDADYEQAIGFPSPGIRARAGVRFHF
jgi:outer membrane cobalamin receptor